MREMTGSALGHVAEIRLVCGRRQAIDAELPSIELANQPSEKRSTSLMLEMGYRLE